MTPSESPAVTKPRIWVVATDEHTVCVFEKNARNRPLFEKVFSAHLEDTGAKLDEYLRRNAFDRLVLAGTRKTLDRLYRHLDKSVFTRVAAEISKELLVLNDRMLQQELVAIVWF